MPSNIPYILMQDRLSTGGSFLLCDSNARGFPIRYASQGFADLFGYYASECLGRKCGDLVAPKTMLDGPALHCLTQLCDLTGAEVQEGVQTLNEYIVEECQQMMAARGSKVGFAVVVNQKKDGTVFACEVVMIVYRHPVLGWSYTVGFQRDVTNEVPMKDLLLVALSRKCKELMHSRQAQMEKRLEHLGIQGEDAVNYLHSKSADMWQSWLAALQSHDFMGGKRKDSRASRKLNVRTLRTLSFLEIGPRRTLEASEGTSTFDGTGDRSSATMPEWNGYNAICGKWHGKVSNALGGYMQEIEFLNDGSTICVRIMGKAVTGQYVLDCSTVPYVLDLKLPDTVTDNDTIACSAPPLRCIAQIQGDELHLCCPCKAAMERPQSSEGQGYCLMQRAGNNLDTVKQKGSKQDSDVSNASNVEQVSTVPTAGDLPVNAADENMKHGSAKFTEAGMRIEMIAAGVGIGLFAGALVARSHWWQR